MNSFYFVNSNKNNAFEQAGGKFGFYTDQASQKLAAHFYSPL